MPPQFKYSLIGLIILNVCVLLYVFSGNPDPPAKQAAVQSPVSTPPPVQQTVYQPPVQTPPQPTQQELQQQTRVECDRNAQEYWGQFMTVWPKKFTAAMEDQTIENQTWQEWKNYRDTWRQYQVLCKEKTQGNWSVTWSTGIEEYGPKQTCDEFGRRYKYYFTELQHMQTTAQRDAYVFEKFGGEPSRRKTYADFVKWYGDTKYRCSSLTGGWSDPQVEKLIEQIRSVSR